MCESTNPKGVVAQILRRTIKFGMKYNLFVQVNTMVLNSVLYDGRMESWDPHRGHLPERDTSFIFEGTQYISAGPTGWNICRFGVTLYHDSGNAFVGLRVYQYPKCNVDVKIDYDKAELKLAFLKSNENNNRPIVSQEDEIVYQYHIKMHMGQKCTLKTCPCRQEKRDVMCTRITSFMSIAQLQQMIEPMNSTGENKFFKINIISSLELCSHPNSIMETMLPDLCSGSVQSPEHDRVLKRILTEKICSDVKLKIGETFLDCHRAILSGHSDVFDAMFQTDMKEKNTGIIELVDMSQKAAECMLQFLYYKDTESIAADSDVAFELLKAGEKYGIICLKDTARDCILRLKADQIKIAFALDLFEYSRELDQSVCLEKKAVQFIKSKSEELVSSVTFQQFLCENPKLGAELFNSVLKINN